MEGGRGGAAAGSIAPAEEEPSRREIRVVFLGLMIVLGLGALDQSIVAPALPRIVDEFGGLAHLSWVVTAYVLTATATMPLYGRLSDQYGRKPVLYAAILIFLLGSALSGAAQSLWELILFRAVQGLGAGGLLPLAQIIIGDLVTPAERGRRQGAIVAMFAVCSIVGPVLGGVITDLLSWHWIFYVNLPIGIVALAAIAQALRRPFPRRERRIDYAGALLLTGSTVAFLLILALGGTEWPWLSPQTAALSGITLVLVALFVLHLLRVTEPVLPPALFRDRLFVVACVVLALASMGMMGAGLFFPLFFQLVLGASAANSGLLTGPMMLGVVISSITNGRVLLRYGRYKPAQVAGLVVAVASFAVLAWSAATSQALALIEVAMLALGLGIGLVMPNMTVAVQNALPMANRGVGTATLAFFRSLGGLVGVTGAGAILALQLHGAAMPAAGRALVESAAPVALIPLYRHAIAVVFTSGVYVVAAALVVILFLPELPLRKTHRPEDSPSSLPAAPPRSPSPRDR